MVFVDAAIAWRDRKFAERYKRGIDEADRAWRDWYERQEAAKARGEPFIEPPPSRDQIAKSA